MDMLATATTEHFSVPIIWWVGTLLWFTMLLLVDLYFHRNKTEVIGFKQAVKHSLIWITLGLALGGVIWLRFGHDAGVKYLAGFLIEKSLSVDNIFVWGLVLAYLGIPRHLQYTVLFWGIFGAIMFRAIFVAAGTVIIERFTPALVFLGIILVYTAFKILLGSGDSVMDTKKSFIVRNVKRLIPFTEKTHGHKMIVKQHGRRVATILLVAIVIIELTDVLFAIDSVPAVLAVARDPYIVLSSNIAAILGLRALYFVFDNLKSNFWLLNKGLFFILVAVGISLILEPAKFFGIKWFDVAVPTSYGLAYIGTVLAASIFGSILIKPPKAHRAKA